MSAAAISSEFHSFSEAKERTEFRAPRTLDDLAALPVEAGEEVYRQAVMPSSLADLDGRPKGRMLAIRGLDRGRPAAFLRALARAARFPWDGKSFFDGAGGGPGLEARGRVIKGRGINRVRLHTLMDWFPFETRIAPSVIDGAPCVVLDYDLPENPWLIRKIHDELREVGRGSGLYLGPAMWKLEGWERDRSAAFVLWFGIDTRVRS